MSFLRRPQSVWWRKAMFQVHLWTGIALCLYITIEGVTGSILVFQHEFNDYPIRHELRRVLHNEPPNDHAVPIGAEKILANVRAAYPDARFFSLFMPSAPDNNATLYMHAQNKYQSIAINPYTGQNLGIVPSHITWTSWVARIHINLMLGQTGAILNGIGGICLLLLCLSGIVIWWPGLRSWTRALKVNGKAGWKRINFDLHSAVGFWTLSILLIWSVSTIYFIWPKQTEALVGRFSSLHSIHAPQLIVKQPNKEVGAAPVGLMLEQAKRLAPHAHIAGVFFPRRNSDPLTVSMVEGNGDDVTHAEYVYFDPFTGRQLAAWSPDGEQTIGTRLITLMRPLHYGRSWGLAVQIIWATLGLALPVLSVTGVLMYWNRSLSKKWKNLRNSGL